MSNAPGAMSVSAIDVKQQLQGGDPPTLLDCRETEELELARIEGAVHIPMGEIPSRIMDLDPEKHYVVFCHHGVRSMNVVHYLREQGFEHMYSMTGGINGWALEVDPSVGHY